MPWNHRVVRHQHTHADGTPEDWLAIHEAYYPAQAGAEPNGITVQPVTVSGETVEELRWVLTRMLEALDKPVLEDDAFPVSDGVVE